VRTRRVVAGVLAMMLGAAVISVLPGSPLGVAAAADPAASDSAATVSGKKDFANLQVTVSQTKNLINQAVKISWTGGAPTLSDTDFNINYLQIMQCWGDDPAGPDRTQCQFGADLQGTSAPGWVGTRHVGVGPVDQNETLTGPPNGSGLYVPFWPAGRDKPTDPVTTAGNDFFDSQVTNEIPFGRTHADGAGEEYFEVETVRQAAGLGCGDPITTDGVTKGRSCWLVIVPRNNKEVDGTIRDGLSSGPSHVLLSSPLSQSNWDNRIQVPLEFQPVGQACPIGSPERPLIGHELAVEAVSSWQPALCAGGGTLFSYTQLPDDTARSQVTDGKLALVTNPIPPDQVPADHPLVYAPVGLSGLAIAFDIDRQPDPSGPADKLKLNGTRFTSMKLTPRLVAKLLTQSYRGAVPTPDALNPVSGYLRKNPVGLLFDPEFLALNPDYQGFASVSEPVADALVQLNGADITSQLWSWVKADPDASAFLSGTPDPFGMVINPNNKGLALPTSVFPRNDQSCLDATDPTFTPPLSFKQCVLDTHPFANDMHAAARGASRGDTLARNITIDHTLLQPVSTAAPRQPVGQYGLLAVVDAATALRYSLPTAQLCDGSGEHCVAPTTEGLLAGEAAMKSGGVAGVLTADLGASDANAYPLTALSYAVAEPSAMDPAAGKDYATFLRYAAGPGQQPGIDPGDLPPGMVPLPDTLKAQTIAAAAALEAQTSQTPTSPPTSSSNTVPTTTPPMQDLTGGSPPGTVAGQPAPTAPGATLPRVATPATTPPAVAQRPVAGTPRTPSVPAPAVGALLLVILIAGALAATSSPVVQSFGGKLRRRWRKGVTPPER
jgi:hypothetical protein